MKRSLHFLLFEVRKGSLLWPIPFLLFVGLSFTGLETSKEPFFYTLIFSMAVFGGCILIGEKTDVKMHGYRIYRELGATFGEIVRAKYLFALLVVGMVLGVELLIPLLSGNPPIPYAWYVRFLLMAASANLLAIALSFSLLYFFGPRGSSAWQTLLYVALIFFPILLSPEEVGSFPMENVFFWSLFLFSFSGIFATRLLRSHQQKFR
ncbi:MAG TPA: ABC-2 transporter permease [Thermotogota bacterium]|nr:ABC-2 transporter permease [Thermotogota bacterium]HRW92746.1 ABC-2 transporter permease [Thermotogota bacterium]